MTMRCDACGNTYDRSMRIEQGGQVYVFDCFACAIHVLAPHCSNCGVRMLGQGVDDSKGRMYCCDHCLRLARAATEPHLEPPPSALR